MTPPEAVAALTLLESLMITLEERGVVDAVDIDEIFETAISAHDEGHGEGNGQDVVRLLRRLQAQGKGAGRA